MLSSTQPSSADWQAQLCAGHVVSFKFPPAERRARCTGKIRPCLVLSVSNHAGVPHALVAYGTSADTLANRGHDVAIETPRAMAAAGLRRPTRFVCARRVLVPLTSPLFRPRAETGTPVLGRLTLEDRRALLDVLRAILGTAARSDRPNRQTRPRRTLRPGPVTPTHSQHVGRPQ